MYVAVALSVSGVLTLSSSLEDLATPVQPLTVRETRTKTIATLLVAFFLAE